MSIVVETPGERKPSRTYGVDGIARNCIDPECGVQLSIYNPDRTCSLHTKPVYTQNRGMVMCRVCKERVSRHEFVTIRKRCKTCDRKPPWEEVA